jgi:hypothetical protein
MNEKYLQDLYKWISTKDNTYPKRYSYDDFKVKMQDEDYLTKMHSWIGTKDPTFLERRPIDVFSKIVKQEALLKKKEPTVSPSQSVQEPSSLAAPPKKKQPLSGSTIKREGDIFTGYPGKADKKYRLDTSGTSPVWMEYSSSKVVNGKTVDEFNKPITNPNRVNALNKYFKAGASTSTQEKIFTGFPGKEKNEYRVRNGVWQRRLPNEKEFTDIYNEGRIKTLNNVFNQDVQISKARSKYADFTVDVEKEDKKIFDEKANQVVTSKLVGQEESEVIKKLQAQFPKFQFRKGESVFADDLLVVAPNDNTIKISLDNIFGDKDSSEARNLREFIKQNNADDKEVEAIRKQNELERRTAQNTFGDIVNLGAKMRPAQPGDPEYVEDALLPQRMVPADRTEEEAKHIAKYGAVLPFVDAEKEKETIANREKLMKLQSMRAIDIYESQKKAAETKTKVDDETAIAQYAALKHDDLTIKRTNDYANDIRTQAKSFKQEKDKADNFAKDIIARYNSGEITKEQFEQEYMPQIQEMASNLSTQSKALVDDIETLNAMQTSLKESVANNYVIQAAKGNFGGGMAYKFVKGLTYIPRLFSGGEMSAEDQEKIAREFSTGGTTKEYTESEDRSDFVKAMFSLGESFGVMASALPAVPLGIGLGTAAVPGFYAQSYYELKDEFDKIEGMGDTEKVLYAGAYGAISAALEKFGIDFISQKTQLGKNLTKNIMLKVFSDLPKDASKEFIDAAIMNNTKMFLTDLGVKTLGGAIVEGGTEGLQKLADVGTKAVYDLMHEKNFFTDQLVGKQIAKDVLYESWLGAIGGHVMATAHSSATAVKRNMRKEEMEELVNVAQVEGMDEALLTNVKASMLSGRMTRQDAKDIVDSFSVVRSKVDSMTPEMSTEQKSVALDLMLEQDRINKQIQGKDPNLVVPQKKRLSEIEEQLKKIGEDATKESNIEEQEVGTEGGIVQREGTNGGQQEVGQGEGGQRETTQPGTNLGDSNIAGEETVTPGFNQPVESVRQTAEEYKAKLAEEARQRKEKPVKRTAQKPVTKLVEKVSEMMADVYEKVKNQPKVAKIKKAYDSMVKETVDQ